MRRDKLDEYERRLDTGEAKARLPYGDLIERLTRERDEAREQTRYQYNRAEALEVERDDAEAAGYRRGIEAALGAARSVNYDDEIEAAILALLEKEKQNDRD